MQKRLGFSAAIAAITILAGCPIYTSDNHRVCQGGTCYACPDPYYSGDCYPWSCDDSLDCPGGYVCQQNRCQSTSLPSEGSTCSAPSDCPNGLNCGSDGRCHGGDCSNSGCPDGFVCKLSDAKLVCMPTQTDAGTYTGCKNDGACAQAGAGAKCLNGSCVLPENQCSDTTQCRTGLKCVDGVCTPSCAGGVPCPIGYSCDTARGVCTGNPTPCGGGNACTGDTTCVEDHCVQKCDAQGRCPGMLVCVNGGCMPDEKPQFVCDVEGQQDKCAQGSICLHHSCYLGCDADAGPDACKAADTFNICKSVQTGSGTYSVCGSSSNLGPDCDPTQNKACTGALVCIDGFCR